MLSDLLVVHLELLHSDAVQQPTNSGWENEFS